MWFLSCDVRACCLWINIIYFIIKGLSSFKYCLEKSQSRCITVEYVGVIYVCLTTLQTLSLDGILKVQKSRISYFYKQIVLMHFVTVELFIRRLKEQKNWKIVWPRRVAGP